MSGSKYRQQHGFTLTQLLLGCVFGGVIVLLVIKLAPEYIEFYKIRADVTAIAQEANGNPNATVADIRRAFERRAEIDQITTFKSSDLDISKDGNRVVVEFAYERKVHLFKNISVLIDFAGSSAD
ncbi:MAG TPA: DUF4845 domain-containing protein [Rhodocyclaceae bacterium]|nr:DUF4845 domain-containing protein [Rhodocyclaceae bacterium]